MSFIVLMRVNIKNENIKIGIFIGLIAVGSILIISSGIMQSIISVDKVTERNGQPFWLASGTANNVDDGFQFNFRGSDYDLKDGSGTYEPQKAVTVFIDKSYSGCEYSTTEVTKNYGFLGLSEAKYKTLNNPSRIAKVEVFGSGMSNSIVLDAFNDRETLSEAYGGGEITIETLGLIGAEKDCPDASNIAYVGDRFVFKNELDDAIQDIGTFSFLTGIKNVDDADSFTKEFDSGTLKVSSSKVSGELDIGSVLYTLEANADIFDSVFVVADEVIEPEVRSLDFPSKINEGDSANMIVNLDSDSEGRVVVTAESNEFSISPNSRSLSLDGRESVTFSLTAGEEGSYLVEVEVCASSQFSTDKNCDTMTKKGNIVAEEVETERCGDGICQSFESYQSCQSDCDKEDDEDTECAWYQDSYTKTEKDYGALYWRAYTPFIKPLESEVNGCKNAGWLNWIFISVIIISLGAIAIYSTMGKKRRGRKK